MIFTCSSCGLSVFCDGNYSSHSHKKTIIPQSKIPIFVNYTK